MLASNAFSIDCETVGDEINNQNNTIACMTESYSIKRLQTGGFI